MLAPYANLEAFMKEWRSRAPSTHRGFGNHSSPAITSDNQSSALLAINRNPQFEGLTGYMGGSDGGGGSDLNVGKIYGIVFGIFGGIVLLSGIIGTWLLIHYHRKMRRLANEEAPRDVTSEQVEVLQSSTQSSLSPSSSSFSLNVSSQPPEMQVRGTNSPSAIHRPASV